MGDLENIRNLKQRIQLLEDCYNNKKSLVSCWQLKEVFYNDENKQKYKWLHIIQLVGLNYTAKEIGKELGYSASTIENQKVLIKEAIENINEWKKSPLIIENYEPTKENITPIIREFAKKKEAVIIILLNSLGLHSYISIGEHIINEVKIIFNNL